MHARGNFSGISIADVYNHAQKLNQSRRNTCTLRLTSDAIIGETALRLLLLKLIGRDLPERARDGDMENAAA